MLTQPQSNHVATNRGSPADNSARDSLTEMTPEALHLLSLLRERRSIRRYTGEPVPREVLTRLLDAAEWAPSAHNRRPWRFCVVTSADAKKRLSLAMSAQWRRDLAVDGVDPAAIERRVGISHARLTGAAALIVACMSMAEMDVYEDSERQQAEWTMATQSVALACQNLLLSAHSLGLGACWMCAPLFVPTLVRGELALPDSWEPQALITVGYPAETRAGNRSPVTGRVLWR